MAIDIRATVTCSLGTLISGSISDDYLQGSGLVKTKGSVEISGTITPAIGTVVTFSYVKGGVTRSIPRKLRVMSSFADPFRRTTKVELGCKLTYLSDLKDRVSWDGFDDPENAALTEEDAEIITFPIRASSIMTRCLTELGITASSSPLTNRFSIAKFDFSAGYVQILSDLLVSESYFGYLDTSEVLQVRNLAVDAGTGPVFTSTDIADLGPIGVGQLPGEAVTVSYSTLKLKEGPVEPPAEEEEEEEENDVKFPSIGSVGWNTSKTYNSSAVVIAYTNSETGEPATATYNVTDSTEESTQYGTVGKDKKSVIRKRVLTEKTSDVNVAGAMVTAYLSNGFGWGAGQALSNTEETFEYDSKGNEVRRILTRNGSKIFGYGSAGLPMVFPDGSFVGRPGGTMFLSKVITRTKIVGAYRKTITSTYGPWIQGIGGQQSVAEARDAFTTASQVEAYLDNALVGSALLNVSVNIDKVGRSSEEVPPQADVINAENAVDEADPANNYRIENVADIRLALGSATAQRRIELSMPYAPDDQFNKTGISPATYSSSPSDAPAKAYRFGRTQNRLLLGNRNGINLQLAPERLPAAPFEPLYVQANGLTAQYRANGTSWAFDSNGIVASVDALFWSAVGGTGTFWFPVAPGITTLPTTPAITDGTMTPTTVVLPYNETAVYNGILRTRLDIAKFEYALTLLTVVPATVTKVKVAVVSIYKVEVPAASITMAAAVPAIGIGAAVMCPASAITITAQAPAVATAISIAVPAGAITLAAQAPAVATAILIAVPAGAITLAGIAPEIQTASPGGTSYYEDWIAQTYGFEADIYPSWWAS
jgi:hypothetical protein